MWEGEGFSLLFVNVGFINLGVKLKIHLHTCDVCAFACVCLFPCAFWLWLGGVCSVHWKRCRRGRACVWQQLEWLWLPCRAGHYLGHVLCVRMCLLLVVPQLELCLSAWAMTPLLLPVELPGGSLPSCVCEWWKLCLIPFASYFWKIHASGWVGWSYFGRGYGKMVSKTLRRNTEPLCQIRIGFGGLVFFFSWIWSPLRRKLWNFTGRSMLSTTGDLNLGFFPGGLRREGSPGDV